MSGISFTPLISTSLKMEQSLLDQLKSCSNKKLNQSIVGVYLTTNESGLEETKKNCLEKIFILGEHI